MSRWDRRWDSADFKKWVEERVGKSPSKEMSDPIGANKPAADDLYSRAIEWSSAKADPRADIEAMYREMTRDPGLKPRFPGSYSPSEEMRKAGEAMMDGFRAGLGESDVYEVEIKIRRKGKQNTKRIILTNVFSIAIDDSPEYVDVESMGLREPTRMYHSSRDTTIRISSRR